VKVVLSAIHQLSMQFRIPLYRCLGILALAASLKQKRINCEVLDLADFNNLSSLDEPDEMLNSVVSRIVDTNPDILGFSTMSNNIILALELCRAVKKKLPNVYTILGGPGASFNSLEILNSFPSIDAIVRGEAERALPDFVEQLIEGVDIPNVQGLVSRNRDEIIDQGWPKPIEDLDELPLPLYEVCHFDKEKDQQSASLEIGRGCPFGCTFCSTSVYFKRKYRVKSIERILSEIAVIQEQLGRKTVIFNHDLLTFDRAFIEELCDTLTQQTPLIRWGCSARLDTIDESILIKMREAGCERIFFGVEVATERMQKIIRKRLDLAKVHETIEILMKHNFVITLSFIVGFPEEQVADYEALWSLIFKLLVMDQDNITVQVHALAPEPGSAIFDEWIEYLRYDEYGSPGHSDLPVQWTKQRDIIRKHPTIFPFNYYFDAPSISRPDILKHVFLGDIVTGTSMYSIQLAYHHLGQMLPLKLVENITSFPDPPTHSHVDSYVEFMESVRSVVNRLLSSNEDVKHRYDSIAQWEIAMQQIIDRKPSPHIETIEVHCNPVDLVEHLKGELKDMPSFFKDTKRIAVFWDEKAQSAKAAEITPEMELLLAELL